MKKSFFTILSASLLVCSATADTLLQMKHTFRDIEGPKNIAFCAIMGGASHYTWVLSIEEELGQRGHNVSLVTTTEDIRFGKPFVHVQTVDIGPAVSYDKSNFIRSMAEARNAVAFFSKVMGLLNQNYERDYLAMLSYFQDNKIDLALCDHFVGPCVDAATTYNIPYIVTASMDSTSESAAPYINHELHAMDDFTTEYQGFVQRFTNAFFLPFDALYNFMPFIKDMSARRKALGIKTKMESPSDTWKNSMKLVNNLFGFTPARPVGPMAEYVGPIIPKQYAPLTEDLEVFLNAHERVAYVAFGQTAVPSDENIKLILTGLLESLEAGSLDGFLWATVHSAGFFPDTITTSSGTTYDVQDMFNHKHPHARMIKWAPQTAVLLHPSTSLFVSHGGLGSWYESMFAKTPMLMFPFFGDQPGNALTIERSGLGGILKKDATIKEVVELFKKVTEDEGGLIKDNVRRMSALTQIHSEHGVLRGADIVEEVAYTHKNGILPHRQSADRRMSYIKSHNLDLYAALFSILAATFASIVLTIRWIIRSSFFAKNSKKVFQQHQKKLQ